MKISRKKIRKLIQESMLGFPINYMDELSKSFETEVESIPGSNKNYRTLKLTKVFPDGCQVIIVNMFFNVNVPGEFNLYLAELATLDANGNVNDECYRKGYAGSAMSEFLRISDKYSVEIDLTAASQDKQKFPNLKLVRFYNDHGFQHYGNPNKGTVEMTRPRKIK